MRMRASRGEFTDGDATDEREGSSKDELRELGGGGKELSADRIVYNIPYGHEIQARKTHEIGYNRSQVSQFEDVTPTGSTGHENPIATSICRNSMLAVASGLPTPKFSANHTRQAG